MAVLEFISYTIPKIEFDGSAFKPTKENLTISPGFRVHVENLQDSKSKVSLLMSMKDDIPFKVNIVIEGIFKYNGSEDVSSIGEQELLNANAVAILFPYLRAAVSSITTIGNQNAPLILPAMNIVALLKQSNKDSGD